MINKIILVALCIALLTYLGLAWMLWWQSGTVDALTADKARLEASVDSLTDQRDQILSSVSLAEQNAKRHADAAASLRLQLQAYERGNCDANDLGCAVDYINRILRDRADRLP